MHECSDRIDVHSLLIHHLDRLVDVIRVRSLARVARRRDRRLHLSAHRPLGFARAIAVSHVGVSRDHLGKAKAGGAATRLRRPLPLRVGRARLDHMACHLEDFL